MNAATRLKGILVTYTGRILARGFNPKRHKADVVPNERQLLEHALWVGEDGIDCVERGDLLQASRCLGIVQCALLSTGMITATQLTEQDVAMELGG